VPPAASSEGEGVRAAELIATLSLATDLGTGLPLEHGLRSTLVAMRLADLLGVDRATAVQTFYGCLLCYVGCTTDAEVAADLFRDGALRRHFDPVIFGTPAQTMRGIVLALADVPGSPPRRALHATGRLPRALRGHRSHIAAMCEVASMLSRRLGLTADVADLWPHLTARWDGRSVTADLRGADIPLAMRLVHVARDATLHELLGGTGHAVRVVRQRAGKAFDPAVATAFAEDAAELLRLDDRGAAWDATLAAEPAPRLFLGTDGVDRALAAMGDFADLASPYLVGHAAGVADLAGAAARRLGEDEDGCSVARRSGWVHDLGRVNVSARIWQKPGPLSADEWEQVRLHAYHSERILGRSPVLRGLAAAAGCHHERLDGSGYHRAATAVSLPRPARLLAAADCYHAMTEPRPHRTPLRPARAAAELVRLAASEELDSDAVTAVLEAAGHEGRRVRRPAGLTEREAQVLALLARGLQTKQVGRRLGISAKTADRHVQNAYGKIGVSTRAGAALFAMQHGLVAWGDVPMVPPTRRP
jgi:HD-GYP domain-containing protein (c-di-GMP phosphodiesterase class II)